MRQGKRYRVKILGANNLDMGTFVRRVVLKKNVFSHLETVSLGREQGGGQVQGVGLRTELVTTDAEEENKMERIQRMKDHCWTKHFPAETIVCCTPHHAEWGIGNQAQVGLWGIGNLVRGLQLTVIRGHSVLVSNIAKGVQEKQELWQKSKRSLPCDPLIPWCLHTQGPAL